ALFIAFMASRNQQLPYLKSRQSLAEKLLGLISENQQDDLVRLSEILLFEGTNLDNPDLLELSDLPDPVLEELIQTLLLDNCLLITLKEENNLKSYPLYLLHLYREKNNWMIEGFDLEDEMERNFPVSQLAGVEPYTPAKRLSRKRILEKFSVQKK